MTYSGLADNALAEFVEVDEEFSDADAILCDACLDAPLYILLMAQRRRLPLIVGLMAVSRGAHVLRVVIHC